MASDGRRRRDGPSVGAAAWGLSWGCSPGAAAWQLGEQLCLQAFLRLSEEAWSVTPGVTLWAVGTPPESIR